MKHPLSTALSALGLGTCLLAACGGRFQTLREVDDDALSGSSGASNAGRGGSASARAGASSAGAPSSAGAGGSANCATVKCAVPVCPGGTAPQLLAGACCATCAPCPCLAIDCPAGTHAETLAGNCCPTCIDDSGPACTMGLQAYAAQREAILHKYRYGCASASECTIIAPVNLCEHGCSYAAVFYGVADSFDSNLSNAAGMYCSSCKQGPIPPCDPPPKAYCFDGQCEIEPK